jgi:hypothetical protein
MSRGDERTRDDERAVRADAREGADGTTGRDDARARGARARTGVPTRRVAVEHVRVDAWEEGWNDGGGRTNARGGLGVLEVWE